jgi:hypothetical protein
MKRKRTNCIFFFLLLSLATTGVQAQEMTTGGNVLGGSRMMLTDAPNLLVVGFEDKMYRSDVDREIGEYNGMDQKAIHSFFKQALTASIRAEFSRKYNAMEVEEISDTKSMGWQFFASNYVQYKYEELKVVDTSSGKIKRVLQSTKRNKPHQDDNGIREGQLDVKINEKERYMNALIHNDTVLPFLQEEHQLDYILLINELDVTYAVKNPDMAAYGGIEKEFKVHYSIYRTDGQLVASGAEKSYFKGNEKSIHIMAQAVFPELAASIHWSLNYALSKEKN